MRGLPDFNYPEFNDYALIFRAFGWHVENPAEIGAKYGTPERINADPAMLAAVMAADLHALETCDAVFLLDGWHKSVGARKELAAALRCGLKIYLAPVVYIPLIRREQAQGGGKTTRGTAYRMLEWGTARAAFEHWLDEGMTIKTTKPTDDEPCLFAGTGFSESDGAGAEGDDAP